MVWSDAGDWERFRTVWHDDRRMMVTWFQGGFGGFIDARREVLENDILILHTLRATAIDQAGHRACPDPYHHQLARPHSWRTL